MKNFHWRIPILICLLIPLCFTVSAQNTKKIDSLQVMLKACKEDTNKVNLYYQIGRQYDYFKSPQRIEYFIKALALAKQLKFKEGIKKMSTTLVTILFHRGMYDVSMNYCLQYLDYLEKEGSAEDKLKLSNTLGNLYSKQGDTKKAFSYYRAAQQYALDKNNKDLYASTLNNMALLFYDAEKYDSSYYYSSVAIDIYRIEENYPALANSILVISSIQLKKQNYPKARALANEAAGIYEKLHNQLGSVYANQQLGEIYLAQNLNDSALVYFSKAKDLADSLKMTQLILETSLALSKTYAAVKNFTKAYEFQLLYIQYNDSVAASKVKEKMIEMEVKYNITQTELQLSKNKEELEADRKQRNFLFLILAVISLLLIVTIREYRQKNKANKIIAAQKKLVDEKQKEILDSIHYAKRIQQSLLTNEKYITKVLTRLSNK